MTLHDVHRGPQTITPEEIKVLVCDIDGTVADLTHRRHFVTSHPKNWPAFNERIHLDKPIDHVIDTVNGLYKTGTIVVMCSGREGTNVIRRKTRDWLLENGVLFHHLYMRNSNDYRDDGLVKYELLQKIKLEVGEPDLIFDDRDRVVDMWRSNGYWCIQVAEGDF